MPRYPNPKLARLRATGARPINPKTKPADDPYSMDYLRRLITRDQNDPSLHSRIAGTVESDTRHPYHILKRHYSKHISAYRRYSGRYIAGANLPNYIDRHSDEVNREYIVRFVHELGEPPNSRTPRITTIDGSGRIAPGNIKWAVT
jgi:hypothetical protein